MHLPRYAAFAGLFIGIIFSNLSAQSQQSFISVAPCRVADTRWPTGTFGGPTMSTNSTRSFPIPSSSCGIPSTATAYSVNVTVVPAGGPLYYLTVWPTGQSQPGVSTLNSDSGQIVANAAIVPAGTGGAVSVFVTNATDVILDIDGYFVGQTALSSNNTSLAVGPGASSAGTGNTAIGSNVLASNSGSSNTGLGADALYNNTSGLANTASGSGALQYNTTGSANSAFGDAALYLNTTGGGNTAVGQGALYVNRVACCNTAVGLNALNSEDASTAPAGSFNTAVGGGALSADTTGQDNTAVGYSALGNASTGNSNIGIGILALPSATTGIANIGIGIQAGPNIVAGSNNIVIGAQAGGAADESGAIRIGNMNDQTSAYVAGIFGVNPGGGSAVFITPAGQLYSPSSSQRYKDDIRDMGDASDSVMQLRPVTFRYKQPTADGAKPLQYGLIAEEVAKIYPELVVYGRDGQVESVQYHQFPALLLNELQKQQRKIDEQESTIRLLESRLAAVEGLLRSRNQGGQP